MLNKDYFVKVMTGLCEMFNKPASEFILDFYYMAFQDYTEEQISSAITKCIRTYKYNSLPKPADIIEWIEGTREDKALCAWVMARGAISKVGYYNSVEFSDPIISHVINEMGGWMWLCSQLTDEMPFIEKRFRELYKIFEKREIKTHVVLMGFLEADNREKNFSDNIPKPVKIGFKEKQIEDGSQKT